MFRITSNAWSLTGDGVALAYRHGVPMQDMEFYQFHPTGIVGHRHPAVRGGPRRGRLPAQRRRRAVHGALRADADGARAARHGQPGDLPGDPGGPRHRRQGLRLPRRPPPRPQGHRGEAARHHRLRPGLPGRRADHRAGADPADRPLRDGRHPDRPRRPGHPRRARARSCPGCTRPGEAPASRVHGANRLGTNSLVDLLVFGRRAGRQMADDVQGVGMPDVAARRRPSRCAPSSRRSRAVNRARAGATDPRASWPT